MPRPKDYAKLIERIRKRPDFGLLQTILLRSMKQAVYSPSNVGHFGLAFDAYVHFTSPIRRYPDLLVHRAIKSVLSNKSYVEADWEALGRHCSETERRADDASRDVENWLKCYYMRDHVGGTFSGSITGVTPFGLFVTLDNYFVDGLVHISELGRDYFQFDAARHQLLRRAHRQALPPRRPHDGQAGARRPGEPEDRFRPGGLGGLAHGRALYHVPMHLNRVTVHVLEHFKDSPAIKTLPAGTTIFKAGDPADFVYILMDGQANLLVGKTIVEVAVRGNLLGEVALIDGKPRSATVVTRTKVRLLPIDAAHFERLMRELPEFSRYVMTAMAERMRRMNDNLRAAQTVEGVHARVSTNTSLSMEEDATLPPVPPKPPLT